MFLRIGLGSIISLALKNYLWMGCAGLPMSSWEADTCEDGLTQPEKMLKTTPGLSLLFSAGTMQGEVKSVLAFQLTHSLMTKHQGRCHTKKAWLQEGVANLWNARGHGTRLTALCLWDSTSWPPWASCCMTTLCSGEENLESRNNHINQSNKELLVWLSIHFSEVHVQFKYP